MKVQFDSGPHQPRPVERIVDYRVFLNETGARPGYSAREKPGQPIGEAAQRPY